MWLQVLCASLLLPPYTCICHWSTLSKHHYFDSFSSLPPTPPPPPFLCYNYRGVWKLNVMVFILVLARCNNNDIVNRLEQEAPSNISTIL
jgi:hypothetical protein